MPFGEDVYERTDPLTWYTEKTPGAYGVIQCKRGLVRRANDHNLIINPKFSSENLTYGAQAEELCKAVQTALGISPDGKIGPATMRALFKPDLFKAAMGQNVDPEIVCKLISLESGFNPSAFNPAPYGSAYANGTCDKGIGQKNGLPSDDTYFDVIVALSYTARRIAQAIQKFGGDVEVAIASYNVGEGGATTYRAGRDYVAKFDQQTC